MCTCGKVRYPTRTLAKQVTKKNFQGEHLRPYRCPDVQAYTIWHIGHLRKQFWKHDGYYA